MLWGLIVIDSKEPAWIKKLGEVKDLEVGDIMIVGEEKTIVIERKTYSDLLHSAIDGRLWKQIRNLEQVQNDNVVTALLITGGKNNYFSKRYTTAMWNGIVAVCLMKNIRMIYMPYDYMIKDFLERVDERATGKHVRHEISVIKGDTVEEERILMLAAVRGIGVKTARKLLERFKSVRNVVNSDKNELLEVISIKQAEHFVEVVGDEATR